MEGLFAGTFGLILIIFLVVAAVLWFLLPFAIFGIKTRLDTMIENSDRTIALIESLNQEIRDLRLNNVKDLGSNNDR